MPAQNQLAGTSQNNPTAKTPKNRSKFPLGRKVYTTHRFGDITPHFSMETVTGDHITLRSDVDLRTMSLSSPLLSAIMMKKDYFNIPMQAILPNNWEKVYQNPLKGDDVPDDANCVINPYDFFYVLRGYDSFIADWANKMVGVKALSSKSLKREQLMHGIDILLHRIMTMNLLVSPGSLLNHLGYKTQYLIYHKKDNKKKSWTQHYEYVIGELVKILNEYPESFRFTKKEPDSQGQWSTKEDYMVYTDRNEVKLEARTLVDQYKFVTWPEMIDILAENPNINFWFSATDTDPLYTNLDTVIEKVIGIFKDELIWSELAGNPSFSSGAFKTNLPELRDNSVTVLNLARVAAYQIVCAHYYSNDQIDSIYSALLYRQMMESIYLRLKGNSFISTSGVMDRFTYNGVSTNYDVFSGKVLSTVFYDQLSYVGTFTDSCPSFSYDVMNTRMFLVKAFMQNLLCTKRSLRWLDYFTGARTQPLAVGNVEVAVDEYNNTVSVVDITKNIQMQRFLNAVNRSGRKFSNYLQELFGQAPGYDYHDPAYLASTTDHLGNYETQNTGEGQLTEAQSITSNIRSNSGKFAFEFDCDCPSILIGVTYYDIRRAYAEAMEKTLYHKDRYDMFNPFMQYIGDQAIKATELALKNIAILGDPTFGYTLRNNEYKVAFDVLEAGFLTSQLDTYCFTADDFGVNTPKQGPEYIRSKAAELDRYFISMTGYDPANRFHFICLIDNDCVASRPMAAQPSIL